MRTLVGLCCSILVYASAMAQGGQDATMEETFDKVRTFMELERDLTIEEELRLSDDERDAFWPIYEDYRGEIDAVQNRNADLVALYADNYEDITEPLALQLLDDYFSIQSEGLEIRQRYMALFLEAIPADKLARFYQMENKIDAAAQLPLMMRIPLLELR